MYKLPPMAMLELDDHAARSHATNTRKALSMSIATAAAAACLISVASVGLADERASTVSARVSVADLDLSSESNIRTAKDRIRRQAVELCNGLGEFSTPAVFDFADCVSVSVRDGVLRLNSLRKRLKSVSATSTEGNSASVPGRQGVSAEPQHPRP